ncbi:ATP-binding protein [Bailinhaonella thermotolerans]|uniref:ATP-binding protein n=1 Tax=Bailinhaonella thermotolerans TaxID=1070861 RepID=A0A3A4A0R6_9ACTN|nr:ATP-binding protein [Bailinhaonella thermotolerans]RJL20400.1 ATP-binding protein [Bailinhaonella thermotolerans]
MATVELTFSALPAHVRTARLIATAVARRTGVDEQLLDEVRLAVGEACSRAVEAHRRHCPGLPVRIELRDDSGRFEVTVTDAASAEDAASPTPAPGAPPGAPSVVAPRRGDDDELRHLLPDMPESGFGLAVIAGLADDVEVLSGADGLQIRMSWPATPNGVLRA